ncbi:MAG: hypothetical protein K9L32_08275 [Chromatiaceae bacterium]|nr:hypothetical protein [Chromatiaceae bacterium]
MRHWNRYPAEVSIGLSPCGRMDPIDFLTLVHLPAYQGLALGATGTRALERFGDLAMGVELLARQSRRARLDVIDECLDLVLIDAEAPAGFHFTGCSLAIFWAALGPTQADWRVALLSAPMEALREAARRRVNVARRGLYFKQWRLWLPRAYEDEPRATLPQPLETLLRSADPNWQPPQRSRFCVEQCEQFRLPELHLPRRGKRFPQPDTRVVQQMLDWSMQRLLPRGDGPHSNHEELAFCLPSLEQSYFSDHFDVRNLFAHLRLSRLIDDQERWIILIDEVQSDWRRDLRRQRLGRPLPERRLARGGALRTTPQPVPECPLGGDWLAVVVEALVAYAVTEGAELIAWVPGALQVELAEGLPLPVAQRLYDRDLPAALRAVIARDQLEGRKPLPSSFDYQTYARNLRFEHRRHEGWRLVDASTGLSRGPFADLEQATDCFQCLAQPVVERLPALSLKEAAD